MPSPGPGKGVPPDYFLGQAQFLADAAHLVLEQHSQRFDQLERHILRQAAHIVVCLDRARVRGILIAGRLDHVGVERALRQK